MSKLTIMLTIGLLTNSVQAELSLAFPFGDGAVLQHGKNLPVWGKADVGAGVTVNLAGKVQQTKADNQGSWKVEFPANGPSKKAVTLTVRSGDEKLERGDLLFGDVWVATGQSNMEWTLSKSSTGKEAIAKADDNQLRLLQMTGTLSPDGTKYSVDFLKKMTPENYYATKGWQVSSPETSAGFSGVAYFFARNLRQELDIPIGVINLAVGGTPIEAHLPKAAFEGDKELRPLLKKWWANPNYPSWCRGRAALNLSLWTENPPKGMEPPHPFAPAYLWEAGIEKLAPFPIKGVLWYQGESNAGKDGTPEAVKDGALNKKKLTLLIEGWRKVWNEEKLPMYYVQLPGLNRQWPVFREMQLEVSQEVENVGMAVTIDVGHPTDVHPRNKQPVGERLARLALAKTYGREIVSSGPIYRAFMKKRGAMVIQFENFEGMKSSDGKAIRGFEIAGRDKKFYPAKVKIHPKYLSVSSPEVSRPESVRYAWANDPDCNLVNQVKLPASPFRTDRWKDVAPSGNQENKK